jgi:hypothetical protein
MKLHHEQLLSAAPGNQELTLLQEKWTSQAVAGIVTCSTQF